MFAVGVLDKEGRCPPNPPTRGYHRRFAALAQMQHHKHSGFIDGGSAWPRIKLDPSPTHSFARSHFHLPFPVRVLRDKNAFNSLLT